MFISIEYCHFHKLAIDGSTCHHRAAAICLPFYELYKTFLCHLTFIHGKLNLTVQSQRNYKL